MNLFYEKKEVRLKVLGENLCQVIQFVTQLDPLFICELYIGTTPHPVTVTTRIITFLVVNPYKPSFATVTGWGDNPNYTHQTWICFVG